MPATKRLLIHVPGFEPLTARQHYKRFVYGCEKASQLWDVPFTVSAFDDETSGFTIDAATDTWSTRTQCVIIDYSQHVTNYAHAPLAARMLAGFKAFFTVIAQGAAVKYLACAWRFALFFLFPFLFTALGLAAAITIALLPVQLGWAHLVWSLPAAIAAYLLAFRPVANRLHTDLLFHDWAFAVAMAKLNQPKHHALIGALAAQITKAIESDDYDEIIITAHSMGGVVATHSFGAALEENPSLTTEKPITFAQLGGALLQSALMRDATILRRRASAIAQVQNLSWLEVQCMTDPANLYKTDPLAQLQVENPRCTYWRTRIRVRSLLSAETYRKIKGDHLRVHRQFVLSAQKRDSYDFIPLVAGPSQPIAFLRRADNQSLNAASLPDEH